MLSPSCQPDAMNMGVSSKKTLWREKRENRILAGSGKKENEEQAKEEKKRRSEIQEEQQNNPEGPLGRRVSNAGCCRHQGLVASWWLLRQQSQLHHKSTIKGGLRAKRR